MQNPFYQAWKIFVILSCIISSYIYGYFAAFGGPVKGSISYYVDIGFEIIFIMDMVCQFFLEFKPEDQYYTVRDLTEIGKRYLKTRFFIDLIA